ncbi:conserved hypothetical protein [Ricinus communis]|uniref:Uncharacterized protein n=1 Tax=Ricinus communis TaxID=3988 RepID=B9RRS5_RICCO|nr:conserved hypothetical protein [Ricinus communis]
MKISSESPGNDVFSRSFSEFLTEFDVEAEFSIKEEMIEEVMQELYKEITSPAVSTCRDEAAEQTGSPSSGSASLSSISMSLSAPSVAGSGKSSESCGASVSGSASSVMAGVEFAGGVFGNRGRESVELSDEVALLEEVEGLFEERNMTDGCDGVEFGDEWLEKVMGWSPLQVEGWT